MRRSVQRNASLLAAVLAATGWTKLCMQSIFVRNVAMKTADANRQQSQHSFYKPNDLTSIHVQQQLGQEEEEDPNQFATITTASRNYAAEISQLELSARQPNTGGTMTTTLVTATTQAPFRFVASSRKQQRAVNAYRRKIEDIQARSSLQQSKQCPLSNRHGDLSSMRASGALRCLQEQQQTTTSKALELRYPEDAEQHFYEMRQALAPWAQHSGHRMHKAAGYSGPWIENHWISHFETLYDSHHHNTSTMCLSDHFGMFIPIFLPWVDHWINADFRYPKDMLDALRSVLRPNVPYVTVSQNDEGLTGDNELPMTTIPNILVLSAGGYGHVPIPLLKQDERLNNHKRVRDRKVRVSYVGSLDHAPKNMRRQLDELLSTQNNSSLKYTYFHGRSWRAVMADSRFSLVPRGYGRTSYHLMETLQMGLVPIHAYSDTPWVPYAELFRELGFVTTVNETKGLIAKLANMSADEIVERERRIVSLRTSHFSYEGTLAQIGRFLKGEESDLRCQKLPSSVRDD